MEWAVLGIIALVALGVQKGKTVVATVESTLNRSEFRSRFRAAAKNVNWQGLPVDFALAHADLESGAGTGSVFRHTNNLFSITVGSRWKGAWNGKTYKSTSGLEFRAYDKWEDSMRDWVQLMHFPIYKEALGYALMGNITGFAHELKKVGYDASEPKYANLLVDRFNSNKGVA